MEYIDHEVMLFLIYPASTALRALRSELVITSAAGTFKLAGISFAPAQLVISLVQRLQRTARLESHIPSHK